jgi:hypothetical protein
MIEDEFGRIDYDEIGQGPTVVLVPGSCSTGAAWRPIIAQWENGFRCVTTSLLGYGGTVERRTALDADIAHEAEVFEAVIRHPDSCVLGRGQPSGRETRERTSGAEHTERRSRHHRGSSPFHDFDSCQGSGRHDRSTCGSDRT